MRAVTRERALFRIAASELLADGLTEAEQVVRGMTSPRPGLTPSQVDMALVLLHAREDGTLVEDGCSGVTPSRLALRGYLCARCIDRDVGRGSRVPPEGVGRRVSSGAPRVQASALDNGAAPSDARPRAPPHPEAISPPAIPSGTEAERTYGDADV